MIAVSSVLIAAALVVLLAAVGLGALVALVRGARAVRVQLASGDADAAAPSLPVARDIVHRLAMVAAAVLLGSLAVRTVATGHAPWSNLHEVSTAFAATLLLAYLALERRHPLRALAPIVAAIAIGLLLLAIRLDDRADPLVPALQQPLLLTVHVGSAIVAYALCGIAFAAALGELVQRRVAGRLGALPSAEACRAAAHRSVLIAFPVLTLAIVLGSVWANLAWRSYWSNDPKELAAAATWLVFGAYLHVAGRRDRWAALAPWLIVLGFAAVLFTFLAASLVLVGEHSYAAP